MKLQHTDSEHILHGLVDILDAYEGNVGLISNQGQSMDGYSALNYFLELAKKVRKLEKLSMRDNELFPMPCHKAARAGD